MTRLFTEGFEMGDRSSGYLNSYSEGNTSVPGRVTPCSYSGRYAWSNCWSTWMLDDDTPFNFSNYTAVPGQGVNEVYISFHLRMNLAFRTDSGYYFRLWSGDATYPQVVALHRPASNVFRLIVSDVSGNSNGRAIDSNRIFEFNKWYHMQLHVKITGTQRPYTLHAEYRVDDETVASVTTTTPYVSFGNMHRMYFCPPGYTSDEAFIFVDDIVVNSADGETDNTWPGKVRIIPLDISGSGTQGSWTGSDGNSVDNHSLVNEQPWHGTFDGDGTYIKTSTDDTSAFFSVADNLNLLLPGMKVYRIWGEARGRGTVPDGTQGITLGIKSDTTTDLTSSRQMMFSEGYMLRLKSKEYLLDPNTNEEWSVSDLSNLSLAVRSDF